MIRINVENRQDCFSRIMIDSKSYLLRTTYNNEYDYWTLGIYTDAREPIVSGIKMVPNFPLLRYLHRTDLPYGTFTIITKEERIGKDSFKNGDAVLYYIPYYEMPIGVMKYAGI